MEINSKKIGIIGGGQLARMFAQAAQKLDFSVHLYNPEAICPAAEFCTEIFVADYDNYSMLEKFARSVSSVTLEFENIPVAALKFLEQIVSVRPGSQVLEISQNRIKEKTAIRQFGFPVTDFFAVSNYEETKKKFLEFNSAAIIKTAELGYDGKGQRVVRTEAQLKDALQEFQGQELILEKMINLAQEASVIVARSSDQQTYQVLGPFDNQHRNGILFMSTYPSTLSPELSEKAKSIAISLAKKQDYCGVLCIEFFISDSGELLINEIAPRPHNSGHLTIEAMESSQFDQQVRAVANLELGSVKNKVNAACMINLLGDLWQNSEPNWAALKSFQNLNLHLYGKKEARNGRKMGHFTITGESLPEIEELALQAYAILCNCA